MLKVIYQYAAGTRFEKELATLATREDRYKLQISVCPETEITDFYAFLKQADVIWHCLAPIDAEVIAAAPRLKLIQKIGVGINTIDLELAEKQGIAVCNMPGTNSTAVAEHTLGLMLAVLRQLVHFDKDVRHNTGWSWSAQRQNQLLEIAGSTIGLVGFGSIPQHLAPILTAMGAQVLYTRSTTPPTTTHSPAQQSLKPAVPPAQQVLLDELIDRSDIISLHLPLTPQTTNMFNAEQIKKMKRGSILINTARGALVDEQALIKALESQHLAGAGLDVFENEPFTQTSKLKSLTNVVLTPHVGWLTHNTLLRSLDVAVENCRRLTDGEKLIHRVV
ncbi:MAG: 2-hydroxyacid dehydrogenase [Pseudomonadales bacterium]|nr:2-hydroxyacid dehydrogenase [Pseudomonadales bacterium]